MYDIIVEAYQNGIENGYDLDGMSSHDLAIDMMDCCEDLNNADLDEVAVLIEMYREGK